MTAAAPPPARVVLLVGPSGCGKTYLARAAGLPLLALDDFYLGAEAPDLPLDGHGLPDWEDPGTWDRAGALAALAELCATGRTEVPDYSFAENRPVGTKVVDRGATTAVVAEGIFAAELIGPLRDAGLLADALLITRNRWLTFARRLWRDWREHRKPAWYLVRQGWAKALAEPSVVAHQRACGARPVSKATARAVLAGLAQTQADAGTVVGRVGIEPTTQGL